MHAAKDAMVEKADEPSVSGKSHSAIRVLTIARLQGLQAAAIKSDAYGGSEAAALWDRMLALEALVLAKQEMAEKAAELHDVTQQLPRRPLLEIQVGVTAVTTGTDVTVVTLRAVRSRWVC